MHAFTRAKEALGTIDGCVTAAGISLDKPFEDQTWGEVARVQDINVLPTQRFVSRQSFTDLIKDPRNVLLDTACCQANARTRLRR